MARAATPEVGNDIIAAEPQIEAIRRESGTDLEPDQKAELAETTTQLVLQLESLQRQGRNGIWHFIISNLLVWV